MMRLPVEDLALYVGMYPLRHAGSSSLSSINDGQLTEPLRGPLELALSNPGSSSFAPRAGCLCWRRRRNPVRGGPAGRSVGPQGRLARHCPRGDRPPIIDCMNDRGAKTFISFLVPALLQ
jgi:hypothetical protein